MFDLKTKSLKYKNLDVSVGVLEAEKRGDPKNEGEYHLIYENKGQKKTACGESDDINENKQVIRLSGYVDEKTGS